MKKLILFGDSLLAQASKHRVLMLEDKLGGKYDVYNCAVGGWDSRDLLKKSSYIAKLKPDVLVLSLGTNDASPWKQVPLDEFVDKVKQSLRLFEGSRIVYFLPMPIDEARQLPEKQRTNRLQKQYHDAAKELCQNQGIEFTSSWSIFMPLLKSGKVYLIEDGVHLNDFAYEVLFSEIARILK